MLAAIPVAEFMDPPKGSRPWKALDRALALKPDVQMVGTWQGEKYFRVQGRGGNRYCVILWLENGEPMAQCTCEAYQVAWSLLLSFVWTLGENAATAGKREMSVLQLQREDALPDPLLDLQWQPEWSAMRSAHSEREIFAYAVISDSGKLYETEIFLSDLGTVCSYCNCLASEMGKRKCRHVKAVLADVIDKKPDFGLETVIETRE